MMSVISQCMKLVVLPDVELYLSAQDPQFRSSSSQNRSHATRIFSSQHEVTEHVWHGIQREEAELAARPAKLYHSLSL